jgi:RNA polymerase sigma-70 factor (family 1)
MTSFNIDKILVDGLKTRDVKSFESIYDKYWEKLFISAFNVLKDEDICKDIVQEIFISLWNRSNELKINNLRAYLFQAIKFQVAKHLRDNAKFYPIIEQYEVSFNVNDVEQNIEYNELTSLLKEGLEELPDKCKEVFKLSRIDGLSNKEISQKLNITNSTVENHINKALKLLRKNLSGMNILLMNIIF